MKKYEIIIYDAFRGTLTYEDNSLGMINFIFSEKLKNTGTIKEMVIIEFGITRDYRLIKHFENIKWRTHVYEH